MPPPPSLPHTVIQQVSGDAFLMDRVQQAVTTAARNQEQKVHVSI